MVYVSIFNIFNDYFYYIASKGPTGKYHIYKLDITAYPEKKKIVLDFRKNKNTTNGIIYDYKMTKDEFPEISRFKLYGLDRKPIRVTYKSVTNVIWSVYEYSQHSISFEDKVLVVEDLKLRLYEEDTFTIDLEMS